VLMRPTVLRTPNTALQVNIERRHMPALSGANLPFATPKTTRLRQPRPGDCKRRSRMMLVKPPSCINRKRSGPIFLMKQYRSHRKRSSCTIPEHRGDWVCKRISA
jgi:hypothetical protein